MAKNINVSSYALANHDDKIKLSSVDCVHISARRWFQKSYGNTYFSLTVTVELKGRMIDVVTVPFEYGYGDHYDTVALQEFIKVINLEGKDPKDFVYLSQFCKEKGITVYNHASDVKRKKDL